MLIKEKQELLTDEIPTIKLEDSDDDEEVETGYIRDTDVLVECKTEGNDERLMESNDMNFPQDDELLMVSESITEYHNNSSFYNDNNSMSMTSFEQMPWLAGQHDSNSK